MINRALSYKVSFAIMYQSGNYRYILYNALFKICIPLGFKVSRDRWIILDSVLAVSSQIFIILKIFNSSLYFLIGRETVKLYNSSLQLVNTTFIESKCDAFYLNDKFIYAKLSPAHPFCTKLNYQLEKQPLFETLTKSCELFVSFVVDKLVYFSSSTNQVYFNDKCFSRLKIFSELSGHLVASVYVNNLRDCSIRIDASLQNSLNDQFICINKSEGWIRCYEVKANAEESGNKVADLVAENFLSDKIKTISNFYLTKDGYYVFIDHLNDSIYMYWSCFIILLIHFNCILFKGLFFFFSFFIKLVFVIG